MEELSYSLFYTTLELETTRLEAQEEIQKREDQITHLKDLLNIAIQERDEAQEKSQKLIMEKLLVLRQQQPQQTPPLSGISSLSSSDCEESIVSSPMDDPILQLTVEKPLPEKGKFLQAVMKAGPLLQTLLLAGPLPQWRHPPPPLQSYEIPPVLIPSHSPPPPPQTYLLQHDTSNININSCGSLNEKKRSLAVFEISDSSVHNKYQRVSLH
ncbi:hypothetical protein GIB67_018016 [Kingdonia uniflora]|uniref:Uncharacterized protein n=1 Tax=Kingdonia uniflora TaxID=39325 RepID=A0A7J7NWX8_9MAGN|nr:hypothetical protein GIB67_018016 [Kingdonia uniflora]